MLLYQCFQNGAHWLGHGQREAIHQELGCVIPLENQRECPEHGQSVGCSSWLGQLGDAVVKEVKLQKWSLQASDGVIFKMALQAAAVITDDTI